jgi:hypothetical protein
MSRSDRALLKSIPKKLDAMATTLAQLETDLSALVTAWNALAPLLPTTAAEPIDYTAQDTAVTGLTSQIQAATAALTPAAPAIPPAA